MFLNIVPSVGILHNIVWVEPSINIASHPLGADARSALFVWSMSLVVCVIVLIANDFLEPESPSMKTNNEGR